MMMMVTVPLLVALLGVVGDAWLFVGERPHTVRVKPIAVFPFRGGWGGTTTTTTTAAATVTTSTAIRATRDDVFYPLPKSSLDGLSEDDALHELFLRQILADSGISTTALAETAPTPTIITNAPRITKKVVEVPIAVDVGTPLEFVYKGRMTVGNFLRRKLGKNNEPSPGALVVELVTGDEVTIDVGQVISCWDVLADEDVPKGPADWAQVTAEALEVLGNMSPRKSDLQEFWHLVSKQRSAAISVDSLDLGVYIFQERSFRKWINPYADATESNVRALSAAQRYAAALLLHNDDFHFKRKPSDAAAGPIEGDDGLTADDLMLDDDDNDADASDDGDGPAPLYVVEGAYKVLDEGSAMFREGEVFFKYYESRVAETEGAVPFRAGCITRQLRALEVYAMSPGNMSPPAAVRHLLKRLSRPLSPDGARMVLKDMNHGVTQSRAAAAAAQAALRLKKGDRATMGLTAAGTSSSAAGSGSSSSSVGLAGGIAAASVTPWPQEVMEAANALSEDVAAKRADLLESRHAERSGKKGPSGRLDFRASSAEHPVLCVDGKKASFLDDAFSLSPETGEILVHVVDVAGTLRRYEVLQATAKERISSTFLPSGPLHMLPPQALDALKLCTTAPNEVITVALSVDADSGELYGYRVFPSVVGPVFTLDTETADELLAGVGTSGDGVASNRFGFPDAVVRDLVAARRLMDKVIARNPWCDVHFSALSTRQFRLDKKTDTYQQTVADKTPANRMVNALLTLYSNSSCLYCAAKGVDVPIAWENRDRHDSALVRRFGTQPLRNWLSQLQQKQLRAALKMELPLSRRDCAMAVTHHNSKRRQSAGLVGLGREIMSFESFEAHCAQLLASSSGRGGSKSSDEDNDALLFTAEGLGRGGAVRLRDFHVDGVVPMTVEKGQRVRVRVKKILPETKTVMLDCVELEAI